MSVSQYQLNGKTVNKSDNATAWKLVHNGTEVISMFYGPGYLESLDFVETFANKAALNARISQLDLTIPDDMNDDGTINVGDAVFLIDFVFKGGPAPNSIELGDANGDCNQNVGDAVFLITYVFKGGDPPQCGCTE